MTEAPLELVTFRLGAREYATTLCAVREVVRLGGLTDLPGMAPPLAGVLDVRGESLPVMDLRSDPAGRGDVLVAYAGPGGALCGVAVDAVQAVVTDGSLTCSGTEQASLPPYVTDVLRGPRGPVFLVHLRTMLEHLGADVAGGLAAVVAHVDA